VAATACQSGSREETMAVGHILAERPPRSMLGRTRRPPNLFGIAFGLAGLGEAWNAARQTLGVPPAVPDAIFLATAISGLS
jgi:hypothetical protein